MFSSENKKIYQYLLVDKWALFGVMVLSQKNNKKYPKLSYNLSP